MKLILCAVAVFGFLVACAVPTGTASTLPTPSTAPTPDPGPSPKNWRVYLNTPTINGMTITATSSAPGLPAPNPFPANAPIVLIGTAPPMAIPAANTPYLIQGYNTTSFSVKVPGTGTAISNGLTMNSDIAASYFLYPLDWTTVITSAFSQSGGIFTLAGHGLTVGDSVYLAGAATNLKPNGAYVVKSAPTVNTFTLWGAAPGAGDSYHYLAKVNATPGNLSF